MLIRAWEVPKRVTVDYDIIGINIFYKGHMFFKMDVEGVVCVDKVKFREKHYKGRPITKFERLKYSDIMEYIKRYPV